MQRLPARYTKDGDQILRKMRADSQAVKSSLDAQFERKRREVTPRGEGACMARHARPPCRSQHLPEYSPSTLIT